jgi:hypothetical protein
VATIAFVVVQHFSPPEAQTTNMPASAASSEEISPQGDTPSVHEPKMYQYIQIIDGCGEYFEGPCVNMRTGPGTEYPVVTKLRKGVVLPVEGTVVQNGTAWYKVLFDGAIRYPERVTDDWYVVADPTAVFLFQNAGDEFLEPSSTISTSKRIIIDRSDQLLSAYDGDTLFMEELISTGRELTPTPRGSFTVYKKTPSRYMQGPIPGISDQFYDLPGVPWNLYFSMEGAVIHGTYWHDHFGKPWSNGCVNLPPDLAKKLYEWTDIGTPVFVKD